MTRPVYAHRCLPVPRPLVVAGLALSWVVAVATPVAGGTTPMTFTVNSTGDAADADTNDGACDTGNTITIPIAGTPECTLRAAIQQSNSDAFAVDRIEFAIPGDGPHTIQPASALPQITADVVIDGYTEPGAAVNTAEQGSNAVLMIELDGENAGAGAAGLEVVLTAESGDVLIRGLAINDFGNHGVFTTSPGTAIEGNFIGTNLTGTEAADGNGSWGVYVDGTGVVVGGSGAAARNVISGNGDGGIAATNGADSVISGNLIGTNAAGTAALPNSGGMELNGTDHASVTGNVISGNEFHGIVIGNFAVSNFIQGNLIGTDAAGTAAVPNGQVGIYLSQTTDNLIGGTAAGEGNVISGNGLSGVVLESTDTEGNSIVGNTIGADANGAPLGNGADGVTAISSGQNMIGGTDSGAGNVIANNDRNGVTIGMAPTPSTRKSILGNSIHSNGELGIDLDAEPSFLPDGDGVTPNDPDDPDTGPNELQNYPVIESAMLTSDGLVVEGTLNSTPSEEFRLEFFLSAPCDASGHGEGSAFMGGDVTTTDDGGDATFSFTFPVTFEPVEDAVITATATDPDGNTSEFSACEELVDGRSGPASPTPTGGTEPPTGGTASPTASPAASPIASPAASRTASPDPRSSQAPNTAGVSFGGIGGIGLWASGVLVAGSLVTLAGMTLRRRRARV